MYKSSYLLAYLLRPEGSLWWERFVKKVGLEPGVKEREGVMDGESGKLREQEDMAGAYRLLLKRISPKMFTEFKSFLPRFAKQ